MWKSTAALLGMALFAAAPGPAQLSVQPESRIWVEGKSTVRDFTCEAPALSGAAETNGGPAAGAAALAATIEGGALKVQVSAMECGNGTMNKHMLKALQAERHPVIAYRHKTHRLGQAEPAAEGRPITLEGVLLMGGQERPIQLEGLLHVAGDGTLRLTGQTTLDMTTWDVEPPSLMLGTMKVRDEVVVHFDLRLGSPT